MRGAHRFGHDGRHARVGFSHGPRGERVQQQPGYGGHKCPARPFVVDFFHDLPGNTSSEFLLAKQYGRPQVLPGSPLYKPFLLTKRPRQRGQATQLLAVLAEVQPSLLPPKSPARGS
ncbi:MAG: hypothetical protein EOO61_20375 [Hymenobacter sp.]|nr:MAG: hypothetical protein EOO61_20375 [Hymenobacter sp.]